MHYGINAMWDFAAGDAVTAAALISCPMWGNAATAAGRARDAT
jgi:hypothetical protein